MFESIINILCILSGIALAVIPLFFDLKKAIPRTYPEIKKFTIAGKFFIALVILTVIFGSIKYIYDTESQKSLQTNVNSLLLEHQTDSLNQIIRDNNCRKEAEENNLKNEIALQHFKDSISNNIKNTENNINNNSNENTKKTLAKLDSSKTSDAFISSVEGQDGIKKVINGDTVTITITICNTGQAHATNLNATVYLLLKKDNIFYKKKIIYSTFTNGIISPDGCLANIQYFNISKYVPYVKGYDEYYLIQGTYYSENKKTKKYFKLGYIYSDTFPYEKSSLYTEDFDIQKMVKDASYHIVVD